MTIYIAADHRGFNLKNHLQNYLLALDYQVEDLGAARLTPDDDYPDYAFPLAQKVAQDKDSRGIIICGSGVGVDIAANKVKGVRCGLGFSEKQVAASRRDDDINILALAADYVTPEKAEQLVTAFLNTQFDPQPAHKRRLNKIAQYESSPTH